MAPDSLPKAEANSLGLLRKLRWPDGFVCPRCGNRRGWPVRELLECSACGHQTSLTAGTIFAGTKAPIRQWFRMAWMMAEDLAPLSVREVQEEVGFASYQTAWAWMHKFRRVMRPVDGETLSGKVEAGVMVLSVGGEARELAGTDRFEFRAALGYSGAGAITGVRIERISDSPDYLDAFIRRVAEPSSEVLLVGTGDRPSSDWPRPPGEGFRRIGESFRAWLSHRHLAYVSAEHFDHYVDEFVFKCPQVNEKRGVRFERLLRRSMGVPPVPYRQLVASRRLAQHQRSSTQTSP